MNQAALVKAPNRGWSPNDKDQLRTLWLDGFSSDELVPILGRTRNAIMGMVNRLGIMGSEQHHARRADRRLAKLKGLDKNPVVTTTEPTKVDTETAQPAPAPMVMAEPEPVPAPKPDPTPATAPDQKPAPIAPPKPVAATVPTPAATSTPTPVPVAAPVSAPVAEQKTDRPAQVERTGDVEVLERQEPVETVRKERPKVTTPLTEARTEQAPAAEPVPRGQVKISGSGWETAYKKMLKDEKKKDPGLKRSEAAERANVPKAATTGKPIDKVFKPVDGELRTAIAEHVDQTYPEATYPDLAQYRPEFMVLTAAAVLNDHTPFLLSQSSGVRVDKIKDIRDDMIAAGLWTKDAGDLKRYDGREGWLQMVLEAMMLQGTFVHENGLWYTPEMRPRRRKTW